MFSTCIRLGFREEFRASYSTNHNHNYIHEQNHSIVHGEVLVDFVRQHNHWDVDAGEHHNISAVAVVIVLHR